MPRITILKRPREEAVITQRKFFKKTSRGKVIRGSRFNILPVARLNICQYYESAIFVMTYTVASSRVASALVQSILFFPPQAILPTSNSRPATMSSQTPTYSSPKSYFLSSPHLTLTVVFFRWI